MGFSLGFVDGIHQSKSAFGKIGQDEFTTGLEHATHFIQDKPWIIQVMKCVPGRDRSEAGCRPRKPVSIREHESDPVMNTVVNGFQFRTTLFGGIDVNRDELCHAPGQLNCEPPFARANIQHTPIHGHGFVEHELHAEIRVETETLVQCVAFEQSRVVGLYFFGGKLHGRNAIPIAIAAFHLRNITV